MTEKIGRGDRQRGVARLTLALVTAVLLLMTAEGLWSPILDASAQSQAVPPGASPTGTETTAGGGAPSPSEPGTPAGTQIQFLNPSKYSAPEVISVKQDTDTLYHLVAWVSNPPADAVVEFEIQDPPEGPRTIGRATRDGNTFELFWDLRTEDGREVDDGTYDLRALLFSSGPTESPTSPSPASPSGSVSPSVSPTPSPSPTPRVIASDQEAVTVNKNDETVEIIDPPNPGAIGVYDPDAAGSRDPGFTILVRTSDGADHVRVEYSKSPPGSEPAWRECEDQTTVSYTGRYKRIGCTIDPTEVGPTQITAVAAVVVEDDPGNTPATSCLVTSPVRQGCNTPTPTPASQHTESGDAHAVTSYQANPTSLSLFGESSATRNTCHEMRATVLDQSGRVVWRANVDVHAVGPTGGLQFAETQRTSAFRAPDQGGHQNEPAYDCEDNADSSTRQQGEHVQPGVDQKHIESAVAGGSDVAGDFIFALRSTVAGNTRVDAWADEDDDDEDDAGAGVDPGATRTITWTDPSPQSASFPSDSPSASSASASSPSASSPSASSPSASSPSASSPGGLTLNCEPETRTNPVRTSHTIVCSVGRSSTATSPSASDPGTSGVRIHGEATGTNDPDGTPSPTTPDFTCVTGRDGTCALPPHGPGGVGSTNDTGTTTYQIWIDSGNNNASEADPTEGRDEFQQPGQRLEPDDTDVVEKTWQRAPLDCEPELDGNPVGTAHTLVCRAATPSGGASTGVNIDIEATGANNPDGNEGLTDPDFSCTTDSNGQCSVIHGPGGTGTTNSEGTTTYRAWVDVDTSNATPEADQTEGRDEGSQRGSIEEFDETDVVQKTWTRPPTSIVMEPDADAASVGTCNAFTITVRGDNNQPVAGVLVDVEQRHERADNQIANDEPRVQFCRPAASEPNPSAVDQTQGDLDPPDENPDNPGTIGGETIQPTDSQGRVTIGVSVEPTGGSDGTGNVTVTAFFETDDDDDPEAGEPQDASTKTWVPPEGRTIVCQPETSTNPVNTLHTVRCTVRDRFGAGVEGENVTFTEDGPGDFTSRGTRTDANGEVVAVTTSSQGGTQTITATIDDDLQGGEPNEVDECDRPAGTPAGAPAGACADSVSKTWVPASSPPTSFERDVTIEAQKSTLVFGKNVTLGGTVESDATAPAACTQFVRVDILRDVVGGASEFQPFATVQSDSDGAFSYDFRADVSANYVAQVDEVAQCGAATSDAEPVLVKVKVGLRLSDSSVRRGTPVRFTVRTRPCPATARDRVLLFRAIDGEFGRVGGKRTNGQCTKSFRRRVTTDSVFQARWPKQAEELLAGKSRSKIVRIVGR